MVRHHLPSFDFQPTLQMRLESGWRVSLRAVINQVLRLHGVPMDPGVPRPRNRYGEPTGGGTIWSHVPRVDDLDSRLGRHDYAVGVTLRSFGKTLWEDFFAAVDAEAAGAAAGPSGGWGELSLPLVSRAQHSIQQPVGWLWLLTLR